MQRVGPYEVVRELGRGAMGVVFEVRHPAVPERLALKMILQPEVSSLERFRREAEVLSFLGRHPNVVGFREAGVEGGHPYIVMDFVDGVTLESALESGMERAEALRILVGVARALHFAHEAEVVHRDVKPANILIGPDGRPLLTDFGVARSLQADRLTLTGEYVGSLAYMAPEQLQGKRASIDRRADVYALGAVLFEVLAEIPPPPGDKVTAVRGVFAEARRAADRSQVLAADSALERLTLRCLADDPEARPATAEVFAQELEEYLDGPTGASAPAAQSRSALTVLLVALVGGAIGFTSGRVSARDADAKDARDADAAASVTPLAEARTLCAEVRLRPKADPAVARRLVSLATTLLAAVDSTRDADAHLVDQAWDCLVAARVLSETIELGLPLSALDRLRDAEGKRVQRAAAPCRDLWLWGSDVPRSVLEETLAGSEPPDTSVHPQSKLPGSWGAVVKQVNQATNWWWGRFVRAERRYRAFAALALPRSGVRFLQYELGMALFQVGRGAEAAVVLRRALRGDTAQKAWYQAARALRASDPAAAERMVREALRLGDLGGGPSTGWTRLLLAELLIDQGGRARLEEAKTLLADLPQLKGKVWPWFRLRRMVARGLGEPSDPGWAGREAKLRIKMVDRTFREFSAEKRRALYPKEAR